MDNVYKVSLGSLFLLTLTIAAEETKHNAEPATVFVTPNYKENEITSTTTRRTTTKRITISPLRFTFPPPRTDQQRSQTNQKKYQEEIMMQNIPATYESIVYNPASKEATAEFTRSNFWDTPELIIRDTNQRKEGRNSVITKSSRVEYTPNYHSIQTPLKKIQYKQPSPVNEEEAEETEEESQQNEETEDEFPKNYETVETESSHQNEELDYPEKSENEIRKPTYPVKAHDDKFNPYETEDFYGDVLNNIGSIFTDEENKNSVKDLLPQFEENSFENLQQQDRSEDYSEENENLEDYDQVEDEETKTVPQLPEKPQKPKIPTPLKISPFPSVKILTNTSKSEKPKKPALVFSPWLPTQPPQLPKQWPITSTTNRPKKFPAKRPKKSINRRSDSTDTVFVTPTPEDNTPNDSNIETNIAQKIDDLYNQQHKQV